VVVFWSPFLFVDEATTMTTSHDAAILDLADRLLDTARGLQASVTAGMVDDFDFQLLQSELQDFYRNAGRIASRVQQPET